MNQACAWKNVFAGSGTQCFQVGKKGRAESSLHLFVWMVLCLQGNQNG